MYKRYMCVAGRRVWCSFATAVSYPQVIQSLCEDTYGGYSCCMVQGYRGGAAVLKMGVRKFFDPYFLANGGQNIAWIAKSA